MQLSDLIQKAYLKATGRTTQLISGQKKWNKMLTIANFQQRAWANETEWNSLYDPKRNIGRTGTSDTYPLGRSVKTISHNPADPVVLSKDGQTAYYTIVDFDQLKNYHGNYCAVAGGKLLFKQGFKDTDQYFGADILVPCFTYPNDLEKDTDTVQVDDPNWLITMMAADWVQSDITQSYLRPQFITEANSYMANMKRDNRGQTRKVGKVGSPRFRSW